MSFALCWRVFQFEGERKAFVGLREREGIIIFLWDLFDINKTLYTFQLSSSEYENVGLGCFVIQKTIFYMSLVTIPRVTNPNPNLNLNPNPNPNPDPNPDPDPNPGTNPNPDTNPDLLASVQFTEEPLPKLAIHSTASGNTTMSGGLVDPAASAITWVKICTINLTEKTHVYKVCML